MGEPLLLCSPSSCWCFACECRTFLSCLKALHVNVGSFFYVLPEAEKLNDLNDLNDHPRLVIND